MLIRVRCCCLCRVYIFIFLFLWVCQWGENELVFNIKKHLIFPLVFQKQKKTQGTSISILLMFGGLLYHLQSVVAFLVMDRMTPVSVSVVNTVKRCLVICATVVYFGNKVSSGARWGTALCIAGTFIYQQVVRSYPQGGQKNKIENENSKVESELSSLRRKTSSMSSNPDSPEAKYKMDYSPTTKNRESKYFGGANETVFLFFKFCFHVFVAGKMNCFLDFVLCVFRLENELIFNICFVCFSRGK